jgi:hypothetical protein
MADSDIAVRETAQDRFRQARMAELALGFLSVGSVLGATLTVFLSTPGCPMWDSTQIWVGSFFTGLAVATSGLVLSAGTYLTMRYRSGTLDGSIGRLMPFFYFFAASLVGPWVTLAMQMSGFVDLAWSVSVVVSLIGLHSLWYAIRGTNRFARLFATVDVLMYGSMWVALVCQDQASLFDGVALGLVMFVLALRSVANRTLHPGFLGGVSRRVSPTIVLALLVVALGAATRSIYIKMPSTREARARAALCSADPVQRWCAAYELRSLGVDVPEMD